MSARDLEAANEHAVAFADAFPVTAGHLLVVPRRHVERVEHLTDAEWSGVFGLVRALAVGLTAEGLNIGVNSGAAAGQTVAHAHVHLIPRSTGDVADPRGGVRHVIPHRADYWSSR